MVRKFKILLILSFLLLNVSFILSADSFTFAVFGDSRPIFPGLPQSKPFKDIINEIELIHPDLMIDVGDLVFGYMSDENEVRRQYQDFVDTIKPITVPFYLVLGNHEVAGAKGEDAYKDFINKNLYYSFTHNDSYFMVLDTDMQIGKSGDTAIIGKEQLKWIENDLEKNKNAVHKFAFMHRPMFGDAKGESIGWHDRNEVLAVESLFKKYKMDIVFAGHRHFFRKIVKDGITYFITGGGGAEIDGEPQDNKFLHYILVKVSDDKIEPTVFQPGGIWVEYEKQNNGNKVIAKLTAIFKNFLYSKIGGFTFIMPSLKEGEKYKASNGKIWDVKDNKDGTTTVRVSMFLKSITGQPYSVCSLEVVEK